MKNEIEFPKGCSSCEHMQEIEGKMYCLRDWKNNIKPLNVDTLARENPDICPWTIISENLLKKIKEKKKLTNADRIRNMPDKELAAFLDRVKDFGYLGQDIFWDQDFGGCNLDIMEWLQKDNMDSLW